MRLKSRLTVCENASSSRGDTQPAHIRLLKPLLNLEYGFVASCRTQSRLLPVDGLPFHNPVREWLPTNGTEPGNNPL